MLEVWNSFLNDTLSEPWMRSLAILGASFLLAWVLRFAIARVVSRATRRTKTDLDDRIVGMLQRPVFLTVVLFGALAALRAAEVPEGPMQICAPLVQTLALFIWIVAALRIASLLLQSLGRLADRVRARANSRQGKCARSR